MSKPKEITITIGGRLFQLLERTYDRAKDRPENLNVPTIYDFARKLLGDRLVSYAREIGEIDED